MGSTRLRKLVTNFKEGEGMRVITPVVDDFSANKVVPRSINKCV